MSDFNSKYTGNQVEALLDIVSQGGTGGGGEGGGTITEAEITAMGFTKNLGTITGIKMNGESKGTEGVVDLGNVITEHQDISGKVDKVSGKQLSTEDFTSALKSKLEGLSNYDDTAISNAVSSLQTQINTLVSGNANDAINSFNEIIAFLDGVKDTEDLASIVASIEQQIAGKMDAVTLAKVATSGSYNDLSDKPTIPSAVTESTISGWGFTKNTGTYSKPSGGIPKTDLASAVQTSLGKADTALQSHQDISGKQDKLVSGSNIKTINGQSILGSGNITIEGGSGGSSYAGNYPVVITGDIDLMLQPNTYYIVTGASGWDGIYVHNLEQHDDTIVNEYIFEAYIEQVGFATNAPLIMPENIKWANGNVPPMSVGKTYVISIVNNLAVYAEF